jgi:rhamnose transport system ATP-binding protein
LGCRESGVHDVSFELRHGEILGLAGLIGAGRTELARVLFGLTPADSGVIEFHSKTLTLRTPADAIAAGIAYLPEDRRRHGVILQLPITANLTLAILSKFFPAGWMQFNRERTFATGYIGEFGIKTPSPEAVAGQLSGGNQQKVALARWLAARPKLIILDEPTQGVDIGAKSEIHKFIRRLAAQGMAVLMISSEIPEILAMTDRVAVMRAGTIITTLESQKTQPHELLAVALGRDLPEKCSARNIVGTPRRDVPGEDET